MKIFIYLFITFIASNLDVRIRKPAKSPKKLNRKESGHMWKLLSKKLIQLNDVEKQQKEAESSHNDTNQEKRPMRKEKQNNLLETNKKQILLKQGLLENAPINSKDISLRRSQKLTKDQSFSPKHSYLAKRRRKRRSKQINHKTNSNLSKINKNRVHKRRHVIKSSALVGEKKSHLKTRQSSHARRKGKNIHKNLVPHQAVVLQHN